MTTTAAASSRRHTPACREPHSGPIPVAAILQRAGVSTRAFYRHFESKDELFLAMLRQETDALADRLDRIVDEASGAPVDQLKAWIGQMFGWMHDAELRMHLTVIDSDEVRAAKGYRETREHAHADRERSLVEILRRGRADGSFPLADPEHDAVAISAVISREMITVSPDDEERLRRSHGLGPGFLAACAGRRADRPPNSDEFRGALDGRYGKADLTRGAHNAVDHAVALVRQQPRRSRAVLHIDLPEFEDRVVRALHRSRAGHAG